MLDVAESTKAVSRPTQGEALVELQELNAVNRPTQGEALLELRELKTSFVVGGKENCVVTGVSFAIAAGQTVALVGESGSGKSVTALSILRLFNRGDQVKLSGQALWRNRVGQVRDLLSLRPADLQKIRGSEIGFVFQDPGASLNPVFTIGSQLRETLRLHQPEQDATQLAIQLLEDVGIADAQRRLKAYPHQLSGGMRQRVMLAITLACQPRLLIADEPTTALDVTIQAQMMSLLADLQSKYGMALLFITHDLGLVAQIADAVIVMYAGQIVEHGTVAQVIEQPQHPYTRALLACRPVRHYRDDGPDDRVMKPIEGRPPEVVGLLQGCRFAPRCQYQQEACRDHSIALQTIAEAQSVRCDRWRELS